MKYSQLSTEDINNLSAEYTVNYSSFALKTNEIISSTNNRHQLLFNEPLGIGPIPTAGECISPEDFVNLYQMIWDAQAKISEKEKSMQPESKVLNGNKPQKPVINLKTKIMENSKKAGKQTVAGLDTVVGGVFAVPHFVFQSLADITAHTEGAIRSQLSDKSRHEIVAQRVYWTKYRQQLAIDAARATSGYAKKQANKVASAGEKAKQQLMDMAKTKSTTTITKLQPEVISTSKDIA